MHGDEPQGTLTSVPFKVTQPWASFLVGGGRMIRPRASNWSARTRTWSSSRLRPGRGGHAPRGRSTCGRSGQGDLHPPGGHAIRRLGPHQLRRLPLPSTTSRTSPAATARSPDIYKFAGLPPEQAAEAMTVPRGLHRHALRRRAGRASADRLLPRRPRPALGGRSLFLPDSSQADERGQGPHPDLRGHQRRRQVRQAHRLHGRAEPRQRPGGRLRRRLDRGGPVPDVRARCKDGDDKPVGPAADPARRLGLPGHARNAEHLHAGDRTAGSTAATASSRTRASASRARRTTSACRINAGIWRYHPTRHVFEVFAHGTSNPWGVDFDDHGQAFIEACVIPHVWHIVQGGRYQRQAGTHFNPYTYDDIQTIADHLPLAGGQPARRQRPLRQRRRRPRPRRR